jgi:hypothetical protein
VPRWWTSSGGGWDLRDGRADVPTWLDAAYTDQTLVTQIGTVHADLAHPGCQAAGSPASSSTLPGLAVQMYRHARITDEMDVLDVGTGSGCGTALLTPQHVSSIDVDPCLHQKPAQSAWMASRSIPGWSPATRPGRFLVTMTGSRS